MSLTEINRIIAFKKEILKNIFKETDSFLIYDAVEKTLQEIRELELKKLYIQEVLNNDEI